MRCSIGLPANANHRLGLLGKCKGMDYLRHWIPTKKAYTGNSWVQCFEEVFNACERFPLSKKMVKMPVLTEKAIQGTPRIEDGKVLVPKVFPLRTNRSCHAIRRKVIIVPLQKTPFWCSRPTLSLLNQTAETLLPLCAGMNTEPAPGSP